RNRPRKPATGRNTITSSSTTSSKAASRWRNRSSPPNAPSASAALASPSSWRSSGADDRRVGPRQRRELLDRQILCALGRLDAGIFQQQVGINAERLERSAQHLAALAERGGDDALEIDAIAVAARCCPRHDLDQCRGDFGRRREGLGRNVEQKARFSAP